VFARLARRTKNRLLPELKSAIELEVFATFVLHAALTWRILDLKIVYPTASQ
jgi:hypothetical protein